MSNQTHLLTLDNAAESRHDSDNLLRIGGFPLKMPRRGLLFSLQNLYMTTTAQPGCMRKKQIVINKKSGMIR